MYSMAKPCLNFVMQNMKWILSHALVYSFIVFEYVNLILQKTFRENWFIFWEIWGEVELFLGIWGAKAKYF